jgi:hypothetical protein
LIFIFSKSLSSDPVKVKFKKVLNSSLQPSSDSMEDDISKQELSPYTTILPLGGRVEDNREEEEEEEKVAERDEREKEEDEEDAEEEWGSLNALSSRASKKPATACTSACRARRLVTAVGVKSPLLDFKMAPPTGHSDIILPDKKEI